MMTETTWEQVAQEAQAYRQASIDRCQHITQKVIPRIGDLMNSIDRSGSSKKLLCSEELEITETLPEDLLSALEAKKYSAVAVTTAFLRRAVVAQHATNCITELLPERALQRADYLDRFLLENGKVKGPLHGLPISVKEHIGMKGLRCNGGFVSWWHNKSPDDALVLKILWEAGCVFFARTTEPQTLMHLETASNLYGATTNPFNKTLSSGGSSGGEGALLGMRGSCLGLGTDIGGSVRSPAANCGLYSLRPTTKRIPYTGCIDTADGQGMIASPIRIIPAAESSLEEQILGTIGPMSTSLEGLNLFMKTVLDAEPWFYEPGLSRYKWHIDQEQCTFDTTRKLKVAVMWHDGVMKPHPPITRALHEVVSSLEGLDWVEVVDWQPHKHDEAWRIISELYFPTRGSVELEAIKSSGEPMLPLSKWILTENPNVKDHDLHALFALVAKREQYRMEYAHLWNATAIHMSKTDVGKRTNAGEVDVILCPAGPGVAPKIGNSKYWGYTSQWNLLNYPALVFPVSRVDLEKDGREKSFEPMSVQDKENHDLYTGPKDFEGAPVGLQLVGREGFDEKVVEVMRQIKDAIGLPFATYI